MPGRPLTQRQNEDPRQRQAEGPRVTYFVRVKKDAIASDGTYGVAGKWFPGTEYIGRTMPWTHPLQTLFCSTANKVAAFSSYMVVPRHTKRIAENEIVVPYGNLTRLSSFARTKKLDGSDIIVCVKDDPKVYHATIAGTANAPQLSNLRYEKLNEATGAVELLAVESGDVTFEPNIRALELSIYVHNPDLKFTAALSWCGYPEEGNPTLVRSTLLRSSSIALNSLRDVAAFQGIVRLPELELPKRPAPVAKRRPAPAPKQINFDIPLSLWSDSDTATAPLSTSVLGVCVRLDEATRLGESELDIEFMPEDSVAGDFETYEEACRSAIDKAIADLFSAEAIADLKLRVIMGQVTNELLAIAQGRIGRIRSLSARSSIGIADVVADAAQPESVGAAS